MYVIINIITNEKHTIGYEFSVQNLIAYYGVSYKEWLIVPHEFWGKDIVVSNGKIILRPLDFSKLKQQAIDYLAKRVEENKATKFVQEINVADGRTINILTDLLDSTLNSWLILKNKSIKDLQLDSNVIQVRYLTVTDNDTNRNEFTPRVINGLNR